MKKKKIINIMLLLVLTLVLTGCENSNYQVSNCIKCGETYFPENVALLSANVISLIKILVPIFIILFGMIEMFKAVMAGDDNKMEDAKSAMIRKFIVGITIFLVIAIVQFVFGIYDDASEEGHDSLECLKYFIVQDEAKGVGEACPDRVQDGTNQSGSDKNYDIKTNDDSGDNSSAAEQYRNSTTQEERQAQREATNVTNPDQCRAEDGNRWVYDGATPYCKHDRDSYVKQCADKPVSTCTSVDYCTVKYVGSERQCVFKY